MSMKPSGNIIKKCTSCTKITTLDICPCCGGKTEFFAGKTQETGIYQPPEVKNTVAAATLSELKDMWRTMHYKESIGRVSTEVKADYNSLKQDYNLLLLERDKLAADNLSLLENNEKLHLSLESELASSEATDVVRKNCNKLIKKSFSFADWEQKMVDAFYEDLYTKKNSLLFESMQTLLQNQAANNITLNDTVLNLNEQLCKKQEEYGFLLQAYNSLLSEGDKSKSDIDEVYRSINVLREENIKAMDLLTGAEEEMKKVFQLCCSNVIDQSAHFVETSYSKITQILTDSNQKINLLTEELEATKQRVIVFQKLNSKNAAKLIALEDLLEIERKIVKALNEIYKFGEENIESFYDDKLIILQEACKNNDINGNIFLFKNKKREISDVKSREKDLSYIKSLNENFNEQMSYLFDESSTQRLQLFNEAVLKIIKEQQNLYCLLKLSEEKTNAELKKIKSEKDILSLEFDKLKKNDEEKFSLLQIKIREAIDDKNECIKLLSSVHFNIPHSFDIINKSSNSKTDAITNAFFENAVLCNDRFIKLKSDLETTTKELEQVKFDNKRISDDLEAKNKEILKKNMEIENGNKTIEILKMQLEKSNEKIDILNKELKDSKSILSFSKDISFLIAKKELFEQEAAAIFDDFEKKKVLDLLNLFQKESLSKIKDLVANVVQLQQELSNVEKELESIVLSYESMKDHHLKKISDLEEENAMMAKALSVAQAEMIQTLEAIQNEYSQQTDNVLEASLAKVDEIVATSNGQFVELNKKLADEKEKIVSLEQDKNKLQKLFSESELLKNNQIKYICSQSELQSDYIFEKATEFGIFSKNFLDDLKKDNSDTFNIISKLKDEIKYLKGKNESILNEQALILQQNAIKLEELSSFFSQEREWFLSLYANFNTDIEKKRSQMKEICLINEKNKTFFEDSLILYNDLYNKKTNILIDSFVFISDLHSEDFLNLLKSFIMLNEELQQVKRDKKAANDVAASTINTAKAIFDICSDSSIDHCSTLVENSFEKIGEILSKSDIKTVTLEKELLKLRNFISSFEHNNYNNAAKLIEIENVVEELQKGEGVSLDISWASNSLELYEFFSNRKIVLFLNSISAPLGFEKSVPELLQTIFNLEQKLAVAKEKELASEKKIKLYSDLQKSNESIISSIHVEIENVFKMFKSESLNLVYKIVDASYKIVSEQINASIQQIEELRVKKTSTEISPEEHLFIFDRSKLNGKFNNLKNAINDEIKNLEMRNRVAELKTSWELNYSVIKDEANDEKNALLFAYISSMMISPVELFPEISPAITLTSELEQMLEISVERSRVQADTTLAMADEIIAASENQLAEVGHELIETKEKVQELEKIDAKKTAKVKNLESTIRKERKLFEDCNHLRDYKDKFEYAAYKLIEKSYKHKSSIFVDELLSILNSTLTKQRELQNTNESLILTNIKNEQRIKDLEGSVKIIVPEVAKDFISAAEAEIGQILEISVERSRKHADTTLAKVEEIIAASEHQLAEVGHELIETKDKIEKLEKIDAKKTEKVVTLEKTIKKERKLFEDCNHLRDYKDQLEYGTYKLIENSYKQKSFLFDEEMRLIIKNLIVKQQDLMKEIGLLVKDIDERDEMIEELKKSLTNNQTGKFKGLITTGEEEIEQLLELSAERSRSQADATLAKAEEIIAEVGHELQEAKVKVEKLEKKDVKKTEKVATLEKTIKKERKLFEDCNHLRDYKDKFEYNAYKYIERSYKMKSSCFIDKMSLILISTFSKQRELLECNDKLSKELYSLKEKYEKDVFKVKDGGQCDNEKLIQTNFLLRKELEKVKAANNTFTKENQLIENLLESTYLKFFDKFDLVQDESSKKAIFIFNFLTHEIDKIFDAFTAICQEMINLKYRLQSLENIDKDKSRKINVLEDILDKQNSSLIGGKMPMPKPQLKISTQLVIPQNLTESTQMEIENMDPHTLLTKYMEIKSITRERISDLHDLLAQEKEKRSFFSSQVSDLSRKLQQEAAVNYELQDHLQRMAAPQSSSEVINVMDTSQAEIIVPELLNYKSLPNDNAISSTPQRYYDLYSEKRESINKSGLLQRSGSSTSFITPISSAGISGSTYRQQSPNIQSQKISSSINRQINQWYPQ